MHTIKDSPRNTTAADEAAVRMLQEKVADRFEQDFIRDPESEMPDFLAVLEAYEAERRWLTR